MRRLVMDTDLGYAERKVAEAEDALSNAIALTFSLKKRGLEMDFGVLVREAEVRQWREYRTMLLIRKGMMAA